jgi:hypothetical protein
MGGTDGNVAAIRYLGWQRSGAATPHRVTGKPERHYELRL